MKHEMKESQSHIFDLQMPLDDFASRLCLASTSVSPPPSALTELQKGEHELDVGDLTKFSLWPALMFHSHNDLMKHAARLPLPKYQVQLTQARLTIEYYRKVKIDRLSISDRQSSRCTHYGIAILLGKQEGPDFAQSIILVPTNEEQKVVIDGRFLFNFYEYFDEMNNCEDSHVKSDEFQFAFQYAIDSLSRQFYPQNQMNGSNKWSFQRSDQESLFLPSTDQKVTCHGARREQKLMPLTNISSSPEEKRVESNLSEPSMSSPFEAKPNRRFIQKSKNIGSEGGTGQVEIRMPWSQMYKNLIDEGWSYKKTSRLDHTWMYIHSSCKGMTQTELLSTKKEGVDYFFTEKDMKEYARRHLAWDE